MICPRCSVAQISGESQKCPVCGYSAAGGVIVQQPIADEIHETIQTELESRFQFQVLLRREPRSILYLARDLEEERLVSLRLLPLPGPVDGEVLQRFEQAAAAAMSLRHPHIVPVLKYGLSRSLLWYSMDAMKGRTLTAVLQDAGPMALEPCLELLEQLASGLEYVHRHGVVHGAVKPSNILVDAEGWARLSDVGIIHSVARAGGTAPEWRRLLSPEFMAPEQFDRRHVGPVADQFSLAAVAHVFLTGASVRPSWHRNPDLPLEIPDTAPPVTIRRDRLAPAVADAIERALARDPSGRHKSVLDFVAVLSGGDVANTGLLAGERPSRAPAVVTVPKSRSRLPWKLLTIVVLVAAAATAVVAGLRDPRIAGLFVDAPEAAPAPRLARPTFEEPVRQPPATPAPADSVTAPPATPPRILERESRPVVGEPATLFVNARPWGVVFIDGRRIGNTPRANISVPAGRHVIRVERDGFVAYERTVQLASGAELRLTNIVLEPIAP